MPRSRPTEGATVARLKSAGVPVAPLLRRVGLTPEVIAEPEERLSVRSQIALLDEAAIALKDLGRTVGLWPWRRYCR